MKDFLSLFVNKKAFIFKFTRHKYYDGGLTIKYKLISNYFKGVEVVFDDFDNCKQISGPILPFKLLDIIGITIKRKSRLCP